MADVTASRGAYSFRFGVPSRSCGGSSLGRFVEFIFFKLLTIGCVGTLIGSAQMASGDKYLEMALELLAKAANETDVVRRVGLEALAESYSRMGEQANLDSIDLQTSTR